MHLRYLIFAFILGFPFILVAQNSKSVFYPKANIQIGNAEGKEDEKPVFYTQLKSFYLDRQAITVAQFRIFVKVNRYYTDAEKQGKGYQWDSLTQDYVEVIGANWRYPLGPNQAPAKANEAVRQVSWNDAQAYATWVGKRLASEYEMEHALRNLPEDKQIDWLNPLWFWCENWYQEYDAPEYYRNNLNRKKSLRGGRSPSGEQSPSQRFSYLPEQSLYESGILCAQDP